MKKLLKLGMLLLVAALAFAPPPVNAFNSATHVYIADHVFPFAFDKIDLYYGSTAPDLSLYLSGPWTDAFAETHYTAFLPFAWWRLDQRAFAKGWQTHNEDWGADFYAHGHFPYDGYVIQKAEALDLWFQNLTGVPLGPDLSHFAVEVAVDLLLVENRDRWLGEKLLGAGLLRSPEDLKLMKKTFVAGDNPSAETLSGSEANFRDLVRQYAIALSLPENLRMNALGELGVQISGGLLDSQTTQFILAAAMNLCQDYMVPIEAAITGIRQHPGLIR